MKPPIFLAVFWTVIMVAGNSLFGTGFVLPPLSSSSSFRRSTNMDSRKVTTATSSLSQHLRTLYPPLLPYRNGSLVVDSQHTLHYQIYGSRAPGALTALFLHGGPGAGCFPNHARFFSPDHYRIVLLDQRGAGQSTPRGETRNNTLLSLVQDCEVLRQHLSSSNSKNENNALPLPAWDLVLGGSWGTTLALAYAQEHPDRVRSLVLRGVCLMRPSEVDWLFHRHGGAATASAADNDFQQAWKNFSLAVGVDPANDTGRDALHAHYDQLLGNDTIHRMVSAKAWMSYEMAVTAWARKLQQAVNHSNAEQQPLVLVRRRGGDGQTWEFCSDSGVTVPDKTTLQAEQESLALRRGISKCSTEHDDYYYHQQLSARPVSEVPAFPTDGNSTNMDERFANFIPAQAMLTCFYSVNSRYALNNIDLLDPERINRIRHIPCIAVQGGLDTICPPDTALDLAQAWPEMEVRIPTLSGHSMYDERITNELVRATERSAHEMGQGQREDEPNRLLTT